MATTVRISFPAGSAEQARIKAATVLSLHFLDIFLPAQRIPRIAMSQQTTATQMYGPFNMEVAHRKSLTKSRYRRSPFIQIPLRTKLLSPSLTLRASIGL